ncbi:hypothetical protein CHLNCDRAFT_143684 [Chlorella variabilis]|uniref:Uncharacterized protein n=1 Tax=Chlorella variabilis TaxID=554065 RepID=E1ZA88_CHLVA|nr:hypothetical protein CHLNCDRAFT_143684 [Chlorella variabilis]EFN57015.1 hypothetical protein CHLNCDRAFT_143684 [Chlorella variabilis]|eukprot:XP_005849117.1 hypothetical protein CHLNCDRAFT_143684 [Chlorella variabilis]
MDCLRLILDAEIVQDLRIDPTLLVGTCPPPFGAPTVIIKPEPAREEFLILPTTPSTTCGGATGAPMAKEEPCHETDGAVESDSAPIVAANPTKRHSGGRQPTGNPRGRPPANKAKQYKDHEIFMYTMFHDDWEKYVVTTNALWRAVQFMLRRLVKEGRLRDPTVICCAKGKNLRFDTDRLKAEGVNSWEAFVSNYL